MSKAGKGTGKAGKTPAAVRRGRKSKGTGALDPVVDSVVAGAKGVKCANGATVPLELPKAPKRGARRASPKPAAAPPPPEMSLPVVKAPRPRRTRRTREQMQDAAEFLRQDAVMTKEEKRRLLRRLAYSPRSTPKERIQAIETDNRMAGHNEPDEVNVNASSVLVSLLRSEGGAANG